MKRYIATECVAWGHPDKVADQISDAILDAYLSIDTTSKVTVETMVKDNTVVLGGEVKSKAIIDYDSVIRNLVKEIGYTDAENGFYYKNLTIINLIGKQSPEINSAVEISDEEVTSGDQGFRYATNDSGWCEGCDRFTTIVIDTTKNYNTPLHDATFNELGMCEDCKQKQVIEKRDKKLNQLLKRNWFDIFKR